MILIALAAATAAVVLSLDCGGGEGHVLRGRGEPVVIHNKVTSGNHMREDREPLKLFFSPALCHEKACLLEGASYRSGDTIDVVCHSNGERITNGDDSSAADDRNPGLFESTRWYGVRTDLERLAYFSEVWAAPRDRGGLGLPRCATPAGATPGGCLGGPGRIATTIIADPARVYRRASGDSRSVATISKGCAQNFVGYCVGAIRKYENPDLTRPLPDVMWFILSGGRGVVASAHTEGLPPPGMQPQRCAGDVPPPDRVRVGRAEVTRDGKFVRVSAHAPRAALIGFARSVAGGWQRIGWDYTAEDGRPFVRNLDHRAKPGDTIVIVACLATEVPTRARARRRLTLGRFRRPKPEAPTRQPTSPDAGVAACSAGEQTG